MDAAMGSGMLAIVLQEFKPEPPPVYVMYTARKPVPLREFLNWMTPRLKARLTSA
jgi:hypothetical protein